MVKRLNLILTGTLLAFIVIGALFLSFQKTFQRIFFNTSGTAVVKEMRQLSRLETATFTIEKIIDAGTNGSAINKFLFGDRILLIANGQVIAGFDLSATSPQ